MGQRCGASSAAPVVPNQSLDDATARPSRNTAAEALRAQATETARARVQHLAGVLVEACPPEANLRRRPSRLRTMRGQVYRTHDGHGTGLRRQDARRAPPPARPARGHLIPLDRPRDTSHLGAAAPRAPPCPAPLGIRPPPDTTRAKLPGLLRRYALSRTTLAARTPSTVSSPLATLTDRRPRT